MDAGRNDERQLGSKICESSSTPGFSPYRNQDANALTYAVISVGQPQSIMHGSVSGTQEMHNGTTTSASLDMRSLRWWEMAKATNSGVRRKPAVLSGRVSLQIALMRCDVGCMVFHWFRLFQTDMLAVCNATRLWDFHMNENHHTDTKLTVRLTAMGPSFWWLQGREICMGPITCSRLYQTVCASSCLLLTACMEGPHQ